jgi:hypothetical protein
MDEELLIKMHARRSSSDILTSLLEHSRGSVKFKAEDLLAMKTVLASRELSVDDRSLFEGLTKGEHFVRLDGLEMEHQPPPKEGDLLFNGSEKTWEKDSGSKKGFDWVQLIVVSILSSVVKVAFFREASPFVLTCIFIGISILYSITKAGIEAENKKA